MSTRTFILTICFVVAFALLATNWDKVKAAVIKPAADPVAGKGTGTAGNTTASGGSGSTAGGSIAGLNYNKVLRKGVTGAEVTELQGNLNFLNDSYRKVATNLTTDGTFGTKTDTMLRTYNNNIGSTTLIAFQSRMQSIAAGGLGIVPISASSTGSGNSPSFWEGLFTGW